MANNPEDNIEGESGVFSGQLKEKNIVQKSNALLLMRNVPFTLRELKLMETYLSRINSHDPDHDVVIFTLSEYQKILGFSEMHPRTLMKYTGSMLTKYVSIPIDSNGTFKTGWRQFQLFYRSICRKNEKGQWEVLLQCHPDAKPFFFNLEMVGYIRYTLSNITCLTSKNSYLLYLYLLTERYRGTWTVSVDELREKWFKLEDKECYKEFKYFKRDVLAPAVKEVNQKTDICCEYKTVKHGKSVVEIVFTYVSAGEKTLLEGQEKIAGFDNNDPGLEIMDPTLSALCMASECKFSEPELQKIWDALVAKFPDDEDGTRQEFFVDVYAKFTAAAEKNKITDPIAYILSIIENTKKKGTKNTTVASDYPEEFERIFSTYPKQYQSTKKRAYTEYKKRLIEGESAEEIIEGTIGYAKMCEEKKTEKQYILDLRTFLGIDKRWKEFVVQGKAENKAMKDAQDRLAKDLQWLEENNTLSTLEEPGQIERDQDDKILANQKALWSYWASMRVSYLDENKVNSEDDNVQKNQLKQCVTDSGKDVAYTVILDAIHHKASRLRWDLAPVLPTVRCPNVQEMEDEVINLGLIWEEAVQL